MPVKGYFKTLFTLGVAHSFLFGMLGAMFVLGISYEIRPQPKQIATVNITKIIRQFTQSEVNKKISDGVLKSEIKVFGQQLEKTLSVFSEKNNAVLLPSEAVISGCTDYTDAINQKMKA